jgi:adenylate cyclase
MSRSHDIPELQELESYLDHLLANPQERAEVTRKVEERFGEERAVLVLDMSGFSRMTQLYGVLSFLALIHEMRRLAMPLIAERGGCVIKAEADNLLCLFDSSDQALTTAEEIARRTRGVNLDRHEGRPLYVSIGIGYGWLLNIGDRDIYGSEVNLASKLGEDIGQAGSILLTASAHDHLRDARDDLTREQVSVSGVEMTYYRLRGA